MRSIATVERTMERVGFHAFSNLEGSSGEDIEDVETCEKILRENVSDGVMIKCISAMVK